MDPLLLDLPTELHTARLLLRPYHPGDGAAYFQALRGSWEHLYEFLPDRLMALHSAADAEAVVLLQQAEWQQRSLFICGVWEAVSGVQVGEAYLANADWHVPAIELGYFVFMPHTRQGFAVEAARALLELAFQHMSVQRVDLQCAADNLASQAVARHCGFQLEGRQRQRWRKKDGALLDRLWFGLLRSEWQPI